MSEETGNSIELSIQCFRPNIVVTGGDEFSEENWDHFQIGDEAWFRHLKLTPRCTVPNRNPTDGSRLANVDLYLLLAIATTCIFAFAINMVGTELVCRTSATTYQLLGSVKTILTTISGWFYFRARLQLSPGRVDWFTLATTSDHFSTAEHSPRGCII